MRYVHVPIEWLQSLYCRPHIQHFHPGPRRPKGCRGRTVAHGLPFLLIVLQDVAPREKEGLMLGEVERGRSGCNIAVEVSGWRSGVSKAERESDGQQSRN